MTITTIHTDTTTANPRDQPTDLTTAVIAAIHEAGHAVAHVVVGEVFDRVTIYPDATGWSGSVDPVPGATIHYWQHLTQAVILLAGATAQVELLELTANGRRDDILDFVADCAHHDFNEVATLTVDELRAEVEAIALVRHWWPAIHGLAKAILEAPDTTLDYDQCLAVVGPRLGAVGTRAHRRQVKRAAHDYARGTRRIYDPPVHAFADDADAFAAPRLAA